MIMIMMMTGYDDKYGCDQTQQSAGNSVSWNRGDQPTQSIALNAASGGDKHGGPLTPPAASPGSPQAVSPLKQGLLNEILK